MNKSTTFRTIKTYLKYGRLKRAPYLFCALLPILFSLISSYAHAQPTHKEIDYVQHWCEQRGGKIQPKTPTGDRYRADCATATHIIEVDFAWKFWEALGQILNYGFLYGKKMGIVLILKTPKDDHHLKQLQAVIHHHNLPIDVYSIRPEDLQK